jgi:hypothetical protein
MLAFDRFRVLTFDCYGTLIDWETGIFSALRPILASHGKALADSALLDLYSELEAESEQGDFQPYREVLQSVVRGFGQRLGFVPTAAEMSSLPESLSNWRPFSDTVPALLELKKRYQLAVISNVDDDVCRHCATPQSLFQPGNYRRAGSLLQTLPRNLQTGFNPNRYSFPPRVARRPEYLSRCDSGEIARDLHRLGKSSFAQARCRGSQSCFRKSRSGSRQSKRLAD